MHAPKPIIENIDSRRSLFYTLHLVSGKLYLDHQVGSTESRSIARVETHLAGEIIYHVMRFRLG